MIEYRDDGRHEEKHHFAHEPFRTTTQCEQADAPRRQQEQSERHSHDPGWHRER